MKIHQLFRDYIPEELFLKLLRVFGIPKDASMNIYSFSKEDLEAKHILIHIQPIIEEVRTYYIPCKADIYLDDLTIQKCITILRQISKLFQKVLVSYQKYVHHRKITFYCLRDNTTMQRKISFRCQPIKIEFS